VIPNPTPIVDTLLPLLRQFVLGEYGIALGGAHAKGVEDQESDVDIYLFAQQVLPAQERARRCEEFGSAIGSVVSWGVDAPFVQGGTDFYLHGTKVECWLRNTDYISDILSDCVAGIVRREFVTWTVMGFYNHCTLSDLHNMVPIEDPAGVLARWKAAVTEYPLKLRETILKDHLRAAKFWPENFHYRSAVARCDAIYAVGIVHQVVHNLIQVLFALNRAYFPGDKKLNIALEHLEVKPAGFTEQIQRLLLPGTGRDRDTLDQQRTALIELTRQVEELVVKGRR
jgi:hypothetical protein